MAFDCLTNLSVIRSKGRSFACLVLLAGGMMGCASTALTPSSSLVGAQLAEIPPQTFTITAMNADILFSVNVLGVGQLNGDFGAFDASFDVINADQGQAALAASVETASVMLANDGFAALIKGPAWFDVENHAAAEFSGILEQWEADGTGLVTGQMTVRGVMHEEEFRVQLTCDDLEQCPDKTVGFAGEVVLDRLKYGMTEMQGIVGRDVRLSVIGTFDLQD